MTKLFRVYFTNSGTIDVQAENSTEAEKLAMDALAFAGEPSATSGWEMQDETEDVEEEERKEQEFFDSLPERSAKIKAENPDLFPEKTNPTN